MKQKGIARTVCLRLAFGLLTACFILPVKQTHSKGTAKAQQRHSEKEKEKEGEIEKEKEVEIEDYSLSFRSGRKNSNIGFGEKSGKKPEDFLGKVW